MLAGDHRTEITVGGGARCRVDVVVVDVVVAASSASLSQNVSRIFYASYQVLAEAC